MKSEKSKVKSQNHNVKLKSFKFLLLVLLFYFLVFSLCGCEAFVRKFTRKPKEIKKEEPIIEPQVYPDFVLGPDALYKDYFLFWETWSDELLVNLNEGANFKKQKSCAEEGLDNLFKMKSLLKEESAVRLNPLVSDFAALKERIFAGNINPAEFSSLRRKVERIKAGVHRNFTFTKVKDAMKY